MIFLGLLIALAAAVFAAVLLAQNWGGASHSIEGFGYTLGSLTLAEIFLAGIILTAIFFLALWLAGLSTRMRRRAAIRRREETRAAREEHEGLAADRDRLARELDEERNRGRAAYAGDAAPGDAGPGEPYPRDTYPTPGAPAAGGSGPEYERGYPAEPGVAPVYPDDPRSPAAYREPGYTDDHREPMARDRDR